MQKTQQKRRYYWKFLTFLAAILFCLAGIRPRIAAAADTQIEYYYNEDVYITGFLSKAPEQQLHWKSLMSGASFENPAFLLPSGTDSYRVQIYFQRKVYNEQEKAEIYLPETGYVMINGAKVYSGDEIELPLGGREHFHWFRKRKNSEGSCKKVREHSRYVCKYRVGKYGCDPCG